MSLTDPDRENKAPDAQNNTEASESLVVEPSVKRRITVHDVLAVAMSIVIAGLVVFCCWQRRQLDMSEGLNQTYRQDVLQRDSVIEQYKSALESAETTMKKQESAIKDLQERLSFWASQCVIVTQNGGKYHTYGCSSIREGTMYMILPLDTAITRGYEPCSLCEPPKSEE